MERGANEARTRLLPGLDACAGGSHREPIGVPFFQPILARGNSQGRKGKSSYQNPWHSPVATCAKKKSLIQWLGSGRASSSETVEQSGRRAWVKARREGREAGWIRQDPGKRGDRGLNSAKRWMVQRA
jgi:hypothetical protein